MTLQYQTRSMWEDRRWLQRVRLCKCLLAETVDDWCRGDNPFTFSDTIAHYLYLCSPRCDPLSISEFRLRDFLAGTAEGTDREFALAWPLRDPALLQTLVSPLTRVLQDAVTIWEAGSIADPSIESVNEQLIDCIVAHKYVVFHHHQTTRRDGGFYGQG